MRLASGSRFERVVSPKGHEELKTKSKTNQPVQVMLSRVKLARSLPPGTSTSICHLHLVTTLSNSTVDDCGRCHLFYVNTRSVPGYQDFDSAYTAAASNRVHVAPTSLSLTSCLSQYPARSRSLTLPLSSILSGRMQMAHLATFKLPVPENGTKRRSWQSLVLLG